MTERLEFEPKPVLSVIVPVLNEADILVKALTELDRHAGLNPTQLLEVVVVDGGSQDGTLEQMRSYQPACIHKLVILESPAGRAVQMNQGAKKCQGDILLFLHVDTRLPEGAFSSLAVLPQDALWGRFDVELDAPGLPFQVIAWFINHRSWLSGIATGDQAMFVRCEVFKKIGGFPDQPLMEDVELSSRLKRICRPFRIRDKVSTSARKWQLNGTLKTVLLMWELRARYALGGKPEELVKRYYSA